MIDPATIQRIKDTAQIVDVVGDYVHLVRRGSNYMGLCPFHNERTPSFSVNAQRNFCYCFSCHKGGSPVNFIMEKEGISYHDALLHLAKRYGIEVEERDLSDEEKQARSERESMLVANEWAMNHFMSNLRETEEGRNIGLKYFYERGLTDEAINAFQLGYAIDKGNHMVEAARKAGFDLEVLHKLGLVGKSQEGGRWYDRFRGRVIYPIRNSGGKVIAFGGRDLKGGPAKYINSPESDLYRKSNELYGIFQAKNQMSRINEAYLVEGYMDVIGMWQSGMTNVVASSGTALTDGQINLMHRFAKKVTLIYDGDNAGIKAALRGIDMLLLHKMEVKVLLLPDGHDPDSFAKAHTPEEFRQYVDEHATDIIRFKTQILNEKAGNDPAARSEAIHSIIHSLACVSDPILQTAYIQECARLLNMPETLIADQTRAESLRVMEQERQKRQYNDINRQFPPSQSGQQISQPTQPSQTAQPNQPPTSGRIEQPQYQQQTPQNAPTFTPASRPARPTVNPIAELEKELLRICVRYGFMYFCNASDEDGNESPMSVIDFIASELAIDEVALQTPHLARIYSLLLELQPEFITRYNEFYAAEEQRIATGRKQGYDEIASKNLASQDIEKEERFLEERLNKSFNDSIRDFAMTYPGNILASHEDDAVRLASIDFMTERNQISKIFNRTSNLIPEYEQLIDRVPRAIVELKDGILAERISEVRLKIKETADADELSELMKQMIELQQIRKDLALQIGERILSPRI